MSATFQRLWGEGLTIIESVVASRANEYKDSWGTSSFPFTRTFFTQYPDFSNQSPPEQFRALSLASILDIKLARIETGEYKIDNFIDLSNYLLAFIAAMKNLEEKKS